jgi:hypothetical protein
LLPPDTPGNLRESSMNLVFFAVVVFLILKVSGIPIKTPTREISPKAKEFLKKQSNK